MKYKAITIFTMFLQCVFAQETFKTSTKASEVVTLFSQKSTVEWAVPISKNKNLLLQWSERKTSFSEKEGIRTFVGYQDDLFVAILSISKGNLVSGNIQKENGEIHLQTTKDGFLTLSEQKNNGKCGTCANGRCNNEDNHIHQHSSAKHFARNPSSPTLSTNFESVKETSNYEILTDGIYREYRLAAFVDYNYYTNSFNSDPNRVKSFWSQLETSLNELYQRDLGIKFKIVDDIRLIATEKQIFTNGNPNTISTGGTSQLNFLINSDSYDIGFIMTNISSNRYGAYALSDLLGAYLKDKKGNSATVYSIQTIAHEIGHLFGAVHTFSTSLAGDRSLKTEPNNGTSIMSIGFNNGRQNFFSLPSIQMIREAMFVNGGYFTDKERTQLTDRLAGGNHPYGKKTNNKAPVIDRFKLKKEYTIPVSTFFQFTILATDPDNHTLLYAAHQADIKTNKARFDARKSSTDNIVAYQIRNPFTDSYTFWLGVNDFNNSDTEHATQYDMYQTKVTFVEGTTFKINNFDNGKTYKVGEKVTLNWGRDNNVFQNTKVRILLTDTNGKMKQILVASTENDGNHEIVIPNEISTNNKIKIEVLDHIAYDITDNNFNIEASAITFNNLPSSYVKVNNKSEITTPNVTATTTCGDKEVTINKEETEKDNIITHTWIATDKCNNTATFIQQIEIVPIYIPLEFAGLLPENKTINCNKDLSEETIPNVQVKGGYSPKIHLTEYKKQNSDGLYYIKRTWTASDGISKPISHTQIITFSGKPKLSEYPQDMVVKSESEVPPQETLTATYCGGEINVSSFVKKKTLANGKKIVEYSWTAGSLPNYEYHTQYITVDPTYTSAPTPPVDLNFTKTPNASISVVCNIPNADYSQFAVSGCDSVTYSHQDTKTGENCNYSIKRVYTAIGCGKSITFEQTISVKDEEKPTFTGTLPTDTSAEEGKIPEQITLTAKDNCSANVKVVTSKEDTTENGNKVIIYKWTATDECGNEAIHTQKILVKETPKPTPPTDNITPPSGKNDDKKFEIIIYNGVSTESDSENYFKIEPFDQIKNISVEIFNELGQKVYQSKNYQQNGEVFRGIANVSGVVAKGKRLPTGTYFYILKCQNSEGIPYEKRGFLFVR